MKFFRDAMELFEHADTARQLNAGETIRLGLIDAKITKVSRLADHLISMRDQPTAHAIKLEFENHEPMIVHPSQAVIRVNNGVPWGLAFKELRRG